MSSLFVVQLRSKDEHSFYLRLLDDLHVVGGDAAHLAVQPSFPPPVCVRVHNKHGPQPEREPEIHQSTVFKARGAPHAYTQKR